MPPALAASMTSQAQAGTLVLLLPVLDCDCILSGLILCWHEKHIALVCWKMVCFHSGHFAIAIVRIQAERAHTAQPASAVGPV